MTLAALDSGVPVGFGLITCDTPEQAWERAGGVGGNKGAEAMAAALASARTLAALRGAA
jgi:6,7-dimethyl-8-ribityllumazine synthase